jgi:hypothetical protein
MIVTAVWTFELAKLYSPTKGAPTAASTITTTFPRRSPGDRKRCVSFPDPPRLGIPFRHLALLRKGLMMIKITPLALVVAAVI